MEYDKLKRPYKIVRGFDGHTFEILREDNGDVVFKDADGVILRLNRQEHPWVNTLQQGKRSPATIKYEASGKLELTTPTGETLQMSKDGQGRVTGLQTPFGRFEVKSDGGGGVVLTDSAGRQLQFKFDSSGQPKEIHDSAGGVLKLERDASHSTITVTRPDQTTLDLKWDVGDRLIELKDSQGQSFNVQYDLITHTIQINTNGTPLHARYDSLGQLKQVQQGTDFNVQIEYDNRDQRRVTRIKGKTGKVAIEQDRAGRIVHARDVEGRETWHVHSPAGKVVRTAYPSSGIFSNLYESITG